MEPRRRRQNLWSDPVLVLALAGVAYLSHASLQLTDTLAIGGGALAFLIVAYTGYKFGGTAAVGVVILDCLAWGATKWALDAEPGEIFSSSPHLSALEEMGIHYQSPIDFALLAGTGLLASGIFDAIEVRLAGGGLSLEELLPRPKRSILARVIERTRKWIRAPGSDEPEPESELSAEITMSDGTPRMQLKLAIRNASALSFFIAALALSLSIQFQPGDEGLVLVSLGPPYVGMVLILTFAFHRGYRSIGTLLSVIALPLSFYAIAVLGDLSEGELQMSPDFADPAIVALAAAVYWWVSGFRSALDGERGDELRALLPRFERGDRAGRRPLSGLDVIVIALLCLTCSTELPNLDLRFEPYLLLFAWIAWLSSDRLPTQVANLVFTVTFCLGLVSVQLPLFDERVHLGTTWFSAVQLVLLAATPLILSRLHLRTLAEFRRIVVGFTLATIFLSSFLWGDALAGLTIRFDAYGSGVAAELALPALALILQLGICELSARALHARWRDDPNGASAERPAETRA